MWLDKARRHRVLYLFLAVFLAISSRFSTTEAVQFVDGVNPPTLPREFRGVWVATVGNIDWPSRAGLTVPEMKTELQKLIRSARATGFNALIFQVRPACEVLYPSSLEPWSEVLTGVCGRAPDEGFDPVAFALQETHAQGMEFHAWINPFRARHHTARSPVPANHISVSHPDWVKQYGRYLWLDPGISGSQQHTLAVVEEICSRYPIDGIHLDDYFYPYPEKLGNGKMREFPDWKTFESYREGGGTLGHSDWRRACIDHFVESLYGVVKSKFPAIKVGISPFGIWRPGHPEGIVGKDSFETIHADSKKWLNNGWMDYCAPQLYWKVDSPGQPFVPLQSWWASQNFHRRHLYPGLNLSRAGLGQWDISDIHQQISATRMESKALGNIHFSAKYLVSEDEFQTGLKLRKGPYSIPALTPEMSWLSRGAGAPSPPRVQVRAEIREGRRGWLIRWRPDRRYEDIRQWVLQQRINGQWSHHVTGPRAGAQFIAAEGNVIPDLFCISAVNSHSQQGQPISILLSH